MMIRLSRLFSGLAIGLVCALPAAISSQEEKLKDESAKAPEAKAPEGKGLTAYKAARIVTVDGEASEDALGEFSPGVLLVRDGRVEGVQAGDAKLPEGTEVVDLGDSIILPGLVDPLSGITQGEYSRGGRASSSVGGTIDGRKSLGHSGIDLKSSIFRRLGSTPYTTFAIVPNGTAGLIAGQASVIRPANGEEKDAKEIVVAESVYMSLSFASGKTWRDAATKYWKKAVDDILKARAEKKKAEEEAKKKAEEAKKKAEEAKKKGEKPAPSPPKPSPPKPSPPKPTPPKPTPPKPTPTPRPSPGPRPLPSGVRPPSSAAKAPTTAKKEAPKPPDPLMEVFEGKRRVFLRVLSPAAIQHLFSFLDSLPLKFDFVLVTGPQPPEVVEKLLARKKQIRGVVLEPRFGTLWETSVAVNTARSFLEKGMPVAFVPATDSVVGHRLVFFHLAQMIKTGVLPDEAVRAVTTVPAKFLGLEGKVGVLKKGVEANFVAFDSDPFGANARLSSVYVAGKRVFHDDAETGEVSGESIR